LDTRTKIVDAARATEIAREMRAEGRRVTLVSGYFDVLVASMIERLRGFDGDVVMACVKELPDALLASRARAELVAALDMVDYVFLDGGAAAEIASDCVASEEAAQGRDAVALIEHVRQRHNA
jgi:hypothetical protein